VSPEDSASGAGKSSPERVLSLFTDVRAGEGLTALLLALNLFVLLGSYYLLKTVRESLILSEQGAEVKSYSAAGQALLLLGVIPAYGWIASRVNRIRLITFVTAFFMLNLLLFYLAGRAGQHVGIAFYIWVGIFNVLAVAQFWGFANDLYSEAQGKRLFPVVGLGASLGAWAGARMAGGLFRAMGPYLVMMVAGGLLLVCILLSHLIHARESSGRDDQSAAAREPLGRQGGFRLVLTHRYLFLIALMTVLLNTNNSVGEYIFGRLVTEYARAATAGSEETMRPLIAGIYGDYFSWVNLLGLLFQLFLASRLLKYLGVAGTLYVLPVVALGTYGLMAAYPLLRVVRAGKILENSLDYSVQNTARHGLFLLTSREAKYKAQAAIETFFWRAGDLLQAAIVLAGTGLALATRQYALIAIGLIAAWLVIVTAIYREHRRLSQQSGAELEKVAG